MRLYLLRHEERNLRDISFFSPLTLRGRWNAENKQVPILNQLDLTKIYSSPFLRALETIEPYIRQEELNIDSINIDHSLAEASIFGYYRMYDLPLLWYDRFKINRNYLSITGKIERQETEQEIAMRVRKFLQYLIARYKHTDENILIISHEYIIILILRELDLNAREIKMGELIQAI